VESLSFGIVALVSARILNWQKERLELYSESVHGKANFSAHYSIFFISYFPK